MRHHYTLTDQTRKILANRCGEIADAADVSDKYVYGIMSEVHTDPFAPFEHIYKAAIRCGIDTTPWDARLSEIRAAGRVAPKRSGVDCLTEKIHRDADATAKLVDALRDGRIDDRERATVREAIERQRRNLDDLEIAIAEDPVATNGNGLSYPELKRTRI